MKKVFLILNGGLVAGVLNGCVSEPLPVEPVQPVQEVVRPVVLTQPAKLTRIPVFAPPPPQGLAQLRDETLYLPLQDYIALKKEARDVKLPYTR